jgi:hypothetical protein
LYLKSCKGFSEETTTDFSMVSSVMTLSEGEMKPSPPLITSFTLKRNNV